MSAHQFMEVNGLKCQVNLPEAPEGEGVHGLPPYKKIDVYDVDEYPACPANWMHGSDKSKSFFFPVKDGRHLWLDFNSLTRHRHEVAIVLSIQGVNPITGPIEGLDGKKLDMRQFKDGDPCPVHDGEVLTAGRYCKECGFKWPAQNYMTTTSWPNGSFWIDGWRAEEGKIRGFLITAETMRGIAAQTIGEDRVWAIGMAFYLSKEAKPEKRRGGVLRSMSFNQSDMNEIPMDMACDESIVYGASAQSMSSTKGVSRSLSTRGGISGQSVRSVEVEKLEIGAGAKIEQEICHADTRDLDFYEQEPAGILYGNYCNVDDWNTILEQGTRDLTAGGEGFMAGLETGNPSK